MNQTNERRTHRRRTVNPEADGRRIVTVALYDDGHSRVETVRADSGAQAIAVHLETCLRPTESATSVDLVCHDPSGCDFARRWLAGIDAADETDCPGPVLCATATGHDITKRPVRTEDAPDDTAVVWMMKYNPFSPRGPPTRPVKSELPTRGPFDIGLGYTAYLIDTPSGDTLVAETQSGGVIGPDLKTVRDDVSAGDPSLMAQQVAEAARAKQGAQAMKPEQIFNA